MSNRSWALVAATVVALIYGVTFTVAKDVMPAYIEPYGFILARVAGSAILFWLIYFLIPNRQIALIDFPRIIVAAFFGVAFNMLTFFKGLSYTSPIMSAVLMVTTPIIVLVFSAILINEKLRLSKTTGILLGLIGTIVLIIYGKSVGDASNAMWGNFLVLVNAASYAIYLIIVKKLMDKYNAFVFVPWIYTFGLLMVLPFGWDELMAVEWRLMPTDILLKTGFIVVVSTFLTYLLNLVSMRELKPTTVAVFIYLQPLFATVFAVGLGKDDINMVKIISTTLIFAGVYLVTKRNNTAQN
ncbi:MAG TPA: DMT family transporter [Flavobacterium sp.]|nr:DMT family transporter [Flavobacterium sp.]